MTVALADMNYVHNTMLGIYQIFYEEICNKILVGRHVFVLFFSHIALVGKLT